MNPTAEFAGGSRITNTLAGAPIYRRPMTKADERDCGDAIVYRQTVLPYFGEPPADLPPAVDLDALAALVANGAAAPTEDGRRALAEKRYRETVLDRREFRSAAYQRQSEHHTAVVRMAHGRPFLARHEAGVRP